MQPDIVFRSFDLKNDSFDCKLIGGKAVLNDWLFGEGKSDTSRFLFAKSCIIDSSAFSFCKPVTLYEFKTPVFYFNTDKKQLSIKDLVIAPIVNRETYYQITGNRGTICNIIIQQTDITDFDSKRLIHTGEFYASALTITNPAIGLYYNYLIQYHPENMIHIDPHQLLNNLPVKINIGAISVNNASVIYTELSEKSRQEGVLSFDKINSHANRLTNMDNVISKNGSFIVKGSGVLFHKSKITASFSLALYDTLGAFTVDARAENINAPEIRKAASALTLLKVDSLQLSRMYGHIKGNQNYTQSELTILYTNLKIELQKTDRNANLKTKPGISLIANTFFVYTDNPMPGGQVRSASTYMPRDPTIPFFPTIVKNIKKGTKKILTKHEKIVAALTNPDAGGKQEKQEKQVKQEKQKKKGFFKRLFGKKENKAQ